VSTANRNSRRKPNPPTNRAQPSAHLHEQPAQSILAHHAPMHPRCQRGPQERRPSHRVPEAVAQNLDAAAERGARPADPPIVGTLRGRRRGRAGLRRTATAGGCSSRRLVARRQLVAEGSFPDRRFEKPSDSCLPGRQISGARRIERRRDGRRHRHAGDGGQVRGQYERSEAGEAADGGVDGGDGSGADGGVWQEGCLLDRLRGVVVSYRFARAALVGLRGSVVVCSCEVSG